MAVGIDGCRGGWFAVTGTEDWSGGVFPTLGSLAGNLAAGVNLIDIPIGLMEDEERLLEREARKLLRSRPGSFFNIPVRNAVYAPDYITACEINERVTGKRISRQTWNICPKIREMDEFLQAFPGVTLLEAHPELTFFLMSDGAICESKKTPEGIDERMSLLESHRAGARDFFDQMIRDYPRSQLARDDIVDAMVLNLLATRRLTLFSPGSQTGVNGRRIQLALPEVHQLPSARVQD